MDERAQLIFDAARDARARRDARRAPRADLGRNGLRRLDSDQAAAVRHAADMVRAPDRAAFYREVEAALRGVPLVGEGALHRILKAARCGKRMPRFDARTVLDRIEDEAAR